MSAGVRAKILAATDYLDVAPRVVAVATNLSIGASPEPLRTLDPERVDSAMALSAQWNLGSSMERAITAVNDAGMRQQLS